MLLSPSSKDASIRPVDATFVESLPKIELHAHLSGSIGRECLHEIWLKKKNEDPTMQLEDPLTALPLHVDVTTFFPLFSNYIYLLCNSISSLQYSVESVLRSFRDDGVCYLELRTTPRASPSMSQDTYIETVLNGIDNFGRESLSTYLILSIDRRNTASEAMRVVELAIKYQSRGVVGVDLCGDPSKGDVSIFREPFRKAKANGLRITLHFAEIPLSSTEAELITLLSFEPDRIGHVIHVPESIRAEIIARRLGLEMCLSCNVKAKLTEGGYSDHHLNDWRVTDCPVVLCTDDVGIFCSGLSNEYLLAAQHFKLSRAAVLDMCHRAINVIFGGEEEKARLRVALSAFEHASNSDINCSLEVDLVVLSQYRGKVS
ncbi:MAG: hypothetical protein M1812_001580 [Candelaria pacifica]|nr:MAG: hypothetical protein M1812_001580 [Candelaria pacifica]